MPVARRVFFSFHYERDVQRASVIRNSWVTKPNSEEAGFIDAVNWEEVKKKGEASIKAWIDRQLDGTSVTAVLIGAETSSREWVRYEVLRSHEKGNGMLGIFMHNIKDWSGQIDISGNNQFGELGKNPMGEAVYFWQIYPTYDWVNDNGYANLGDWIERAARLAGK
jgi:hypothetical protein